MSSYLRYLYDIQDETYWLPILLKMYGHCHERLMIWRSPGISGKVQGSFIFLVVGYMNPLPGSI
jgi:hypothetical protein